MLDEETLYARFISGELSDEEITKLKSNGDWKKLSAIAEMSSTFTLPAYDKNKGFESLKNKRQKDTPKTIGINWKPWIGLAASVLLLISVIFFFQDQSVILTSDLGNSLAHNFPEASEVELNADSKLSYVKKTWAKNRKVYLEGEAFFNVTKGSSFIVETPQGTIEVLGTAFNVKSRPEIFEVECYEGRVKVTKKEKQTILTASKGVYDNDNLLSVDIENKDPHWKNGRSLFREANLSDVLSELERQYKIKVTSMVKGKFTGSFIHNDLKKAVEQISKPLGLTFSISDDQKEVSFTK